MTTDNSQQDASTNQPDQAVAQDADVLKNYSTTSVGHQGANDEDPTGAKAAGGLVNSDLDPEPTDEGSRRAGKGAFGAGQ